MSAQLPRTAKDVFALSPRDWLIYTGLIGFARVSGCWRYPVPASGDIETMTRRDKIYWLYKAQFPVTKAAKGSSLEAFFAEQSSFPWTLPSGFRLASELTMSAVGDLMTHAYLAHSAGHLYERVVDEVFGADLSMANLECVIYPAGIRALKIRPTQAPPLCYSLDDFNAAKGFDGCTFSFMATACNHSLDCGEAGVEFTTQTLRDAGIAFSGMNESEDAASSAAVIETEGFTIGVLSHTFGLNANRPPADKPWIVNRTNLNDSADQVDFSGFERQIDFCRRQAVDLVVAQVHWGLEHEYYPRPRQLDVARQLAEMGCDVVIGHHPHVVQPMECYRTARDPARVVPIYYSLGNLVNPFSHPAFCRGAIARIVLGKGVAGDGTPRTYVTHAKMVDVFQEIDTNDRLRLTTGERRRRV